MHKSRRISISEKIILSMIMAMVWSTVGLGQGYTDQQFHSRVFGHEKHYRIYLPEDYHKGTGRYPVVYYFHGNNSRYNHFQPGDVDFEQVSELVGEAEVILVMWDGITTEDNSHPYNVGLHSYVRDKIQWKDYFPEFIHHIDATYRTIPDREHRAIIGYSMGGFLSFFMAGKYPHLICAAVNLVGAPEFFVGTPDQHTYFKIGHHMKNLHGVHTRFHNSTSGELTYMNHENHLAAIRERGLSYVYKKYPGGHQIDNPGEIKAFKEAFHFVMEAFENPLPKPVRWHHSDLYADFEVWGYTVHSDLNETGFIALKGVTAQGLNCRTRKWTPYGRIIPGVNIQIHTAPLYKPDAEYTILDYEVKTGKKVFFKTRSNEAGSISLQLNSKEHHIGIWGEAGVPEVVFVDYRVEKDQVFLRQGQQQNLRIQLLNRGNEDSGEITVSLSTPMQKVIIENPTIRVGNIPAGETLWVTPSFVVKPDVNAPESFQPPGVRFDLDIQSSAAQKWIDEFDVPVFFKVPEFHDFLIDDGMKIDSLAHGIGNGNGIPEPGESIVIFTDKKQPLEVYYNDPFVSEQEEGRYDFNLPCKWGDGESFATIVKISGDCPVGHQITFLGNYQQKTWETMERTLHWGRVILKVK